MIKCIYQSGVTFLSAIHIFRVLRKIVSLTIFRAGCDFSQFSLVITEVHSELSISQNLRKIASLTIFCVTCDFSQFFVMLIINQTELRI